MILDVLALLVANAWILIAGVGVLRLATGSRLAPSWPSLGLAYVVGVAAVGVAAQLVLMAGLALTVQEVMVLCGALFLAGFLRRPVAAALTTRRSEHGGLPTTRVTAALVGAFLLLVAVDLAFQPLFRPDAWAQWTAKARAIVLMDGLDTAFFTSSTTVQNPDYPLLVPSLEAIVFRFMGFDTQLIHLQFFLVLAGFTLALVALTRGRAPRAIVWASVAAIVFAPATAIQTASAYADVPVAVFFALAGVAAWRWLEDAHLPSLVLLSLFSAAALATKVEGVVLILALFAVLVPLVARRSLRLGALTAGAGLAALVGIAPWYAWRRAHDIPGVVAFRRGVSPDVLSDQADRVPTAVGTLAVELFDPTSWLLLVPLALAATALVLRYGRRRDGAILTLGVLVLAFVGLVWTYWAGEYPLDWHLSVSSDRVVVGPVFFAAALTPLLLASALGGSGGEPGAVARVQTRLGEEGDGRPGTAEAGRVADAPVTG